MGDGRPYSPPQQDRNRESWRILYGDIEVGWIGQRSGVPKDAEQWGWHCGFFALPIGKQLEA